MASTVASAIRPGLRERQQSGSPHTPSRYISSVQSSPGSSFFRAEEDPIIIALNPRELSVGFQGESGPQCTIAFTPQNSRRIGDYRTHLTSYKRREENIQARCKDYELWTSDVKDVDLGLLDDKLERAVREAYTKHLLVDAGSARMILVLPSLVPHPVLSTILTLLFERWKYSSITLLPTPTMTIAGSGLRSGLVVEIGWEETVVTAIYEYREIHMRRTVRAMKALTCQIAIVLDGVRKGQRDAAQDDFVFDFDFVEDFIDRAGGCHALVRASEDGLTEGIAGMGLVEQSAPQAGRDDDIVIDWPTGSSYRPVSIPRAALHQACVESLTGRQNEDHPDDHEQSISQVLYRTLLELSPDVRAICLPRIIFVGRGSRVAGLSELILNETQSIITRYGWTAVRGKHFDAKRSGLTELAQGRAVPAEARHGITVPVAGDFVEERLSKQKSKDASTAVPVTVREVSSLGAWAGASLVASLKAKSFVEIEREKFLSQGLAGAHRDLDSSVTSQRLTTAKSTERTSWTLAGWA